MAKVTEIRHLPGHHLLWYREPIHSAVRVLETPGIDVVFSESLPRPFLSHVYS